MVKTILFQSMSKVIYQNTKTLKTKPNNNSSDAIAPNYIWGCLGGCMNSYCYVGRYNRDKVYVNQNVADIHKSVEDWVEEQPWPKEPNQQDPTYYTIDIGCNTDMALHQKHLKRSMGLIAILDYYDSHLKLKATFATKYPTMLKGIDVKHFNKPPRVRVSLMPEIYKEYLEENTDNIADRIEMINSLIENGWEVHINLSPVIMHFNNWIENYRALLHMIRSTVKYSYLENTIKFEVIFLTSHPNSIRHLKFMCEDTNDHHNFIALDIMNDVSEQKKPNGVTRYPLKRKTKAVHELKATIDAILPMCEIRYIF